MQVLRHYREVLGRDVAGLDTAALDWRPTTAAVSIATILLHIAAVEYLVISAVTAQPEGMEPVDRALWEALLPGFARELGLAPCTGRPLSHYTDLLGRVRGKTEALLADSWRPVDLEFAQQALLDRLELEPGQRDAVGAPLGLPMSIAEGGDKELVVLALIAHESYHRGHITQTKFLRRTRADFASRATTNPPGGT